MNQLVFASRLYKQTQHGISDAVRGPASRDQQHPNMDAFVLIAFPVTIRNITQISPEHKQAQDCNKPPETLTSYHPSLSLIAPQEGCSATPWRKETPL